MVMYFEKELIVSVPLAQAWEALSNTEHINRQLGLPPIVYEESSSEHGKHVRTARCKLGPVTISWDEHPFEWMKERSYQVRRVFHNGPVDTEVGGVTFESVDGAETPQVRIKIFATITARSLLWAPFANWFGRLAVGKIAEYTKRLETFHAHKPVAISQPSRAPARVNRELLTSRCERLAKRPRIEPVQVERLEQLILQAADDEVLRMQAYALADRWGMSRQDALDLCFGATAEGILDLDWEMMCPHCRVGKKGAKTFGALGDSYYCEFCGVDFEIDIEKYTELRFNANDQIRMVEDALFCVGSPQRTPHIELQGHIGPGEEKTLEPDLGDEEFQIRVLADNTRFSIHPAKSLKNGTAVRAVLTDDGFRCDDPRFVPGPTKILLRNDTARDVVVAVERVKWDPYALTAAEVMLMPRFRRLFSGQVLDPGQKIGVKAICILFTDLKGSTELYEKVGDAPAYGDVRAHFKFLKEHIDAAGGAIIKTIGDAVMAAFPTTADGMRAALSIQSDIEAFNTGGEVQHQMVVKIGLHAGPAIMINANGYNDYFGRTVNIAARAQGLSEGMDLLFAEEHLDSPGVTSVLRDYRFEKQTFSTHLRGINQEFSMVRLTSIRSPEEKTDKKADKKMDKKTDKKSGKAA